jgi:hypothetical protein
MSNCYWFWIERQVRNAVDGSRFGRKLPSNPRSERHPARKDTAAVVGNFSRAEFNFYQQARRSLPRCTTYKVTE